MGKIKSKLIRRTASSLSKEGIEFSESFEKNKKILGSEMPSKKLRNQMASIVEGGFEAMLYVTLTTPGTSDVILLANPSNTPKGISVGCAVLASILFQHLTSI